MARCRRMPLKMASSTDDKHLLASAYQQKKQRRLLLPQFSSRPSAKAAAAPHSIQRRSTHPIFTMFPRPNNPSGTYRCCWQQQKQPQLLCWAPHRHPFFLGPILCVPHWGSALCPQQPIQFHPLAPVPLSTSNSISSSSI